MPEYLAPGVFVEEVSYRSKSVQGVPTSTTGFVGVTRFGPMHYKGGPQTSEPRLVTSYAEFERIYGDLRPISLGLSDPWLPYVSHAARAFFLNGGRRLYISRVHKPTAVPLPAGGGPVDALAAAALAHVEVPIEPPPAQPPPGAPVVPRDQFRFTARWPGTDGNVSVTVTGVRGGDIGLHGAGPVVPESTAHGTIVEVVPSLPPLVPAPAGQPQPPRRRPQTPEARAPIDIAQLRFIHVATDPTTNVRTVTFVNHTGVATTPDPADLLLPITVTVSVAGPGERVAAYSRMGLWPDGRGAISRVMSWDFPADEDCAVAFDFPVTDTTTLPISPTPPSPAPTAPLSNPPTAAEVAPLIRYLNLTSALVNNTPPTPAVPRVPTSTPPTQTYRLDNGSDGQLPTPDDFNGHSADPDDINIKATGLQALAEVEDIAIVAGPDFGAFDSDDAISEATQFLIDHAVQCRYRIAVVDGPRGASINKIRSFRATFDSSYAALYAPWIEILDPNGAPAPGVPIPHLLLPPSGFVTGIYARTDISRGVFKAPANEVVYGLTKFEMNINQGRDEVLNPENINALRVFRRGGARVWGARTMSLDPEWLYVPVRRYFLFLEHSIDNSTQWCVFEPNGEALWRKVVTEISEFLEAQWRDGALMGDSPDQAFFVLCDRSTMTQNDLDNGRLICLVGVAPIKPAEFVIFRIGQWTASAQG